jgi:hypothetical protein
MTCCTQLVMSHGDVPVFKFSTHVFVAEQLLQLVQRYIGSNVVISHQFTSGEIAPMNLSGLPGPSGGCEFYIVTDLPRAFLGNGSVNTFQRSTVEDVSQWTNVTARC